MEPKWHEEIDDMDNSTWEAASPYHDDDSPFYWRLRPRISGNQIEWYECHDLELMDEDSPRGWPTLEEAKAGIAARHAEIIEAEGLQSGAAPESCPYARLAAEFKGTEYSAIRCPACGAKMATHAEDHLCRMHRDSTGICTVCNGSRAQDRLK